MKIGRLFILAIAAASAGIIPMADVERHTILAALEQVKGDKLQAAQLLGIGKTTLYRKLKSYGVV